ncbi:CDP-alcohol phosphatidyltransferase family protein [Denitromonas ohlonensis]|uniref:CDP-alcohol phosphatidyltransferase family protein n=2 Tax=Denitromonas TaxID=139331 RepID=A0A557R542_9RHOO|nr:CDP-alcohol phosphatidyltransferase family protein [Denitromonas ohlonensis]TVO60277.1 CDP-alcohol phosphatidyltransferase family protein [Denitromonas ohlonensis]TVO75744.1 CDP-alcohol phosphatidyltransferase family protein [Denitromonas ohlonensis]
MTSSWFSRVFSDAHANHKTIGNNLLLLGMYRAAYPAAAAFNRLGFSPNLLTGLSCLTTLAAAIALATREGAVLFCLLWALSVLLDFCDGTVARMASKVSRNAFRFDHMSDLAKISAILIAAGIRHDSITLWSLCSIALFSFLYYAVLSQELKYAQTQFDRKSEANAATAAAAGLQSRMPSAVRIIYAIFGTLNGHTLLIFFALPFAPVPIAVALIYLTLISLSGSAARIRRLMSLPKP